MNISYNWLKNYLNIDKTPDELSLILTDVGLEVEAVEKVQSIPGGLEGLVVGEVLSAEQHPNADKLRVTKINIGGETPFVEGLGTPVYDPDEVIEIFEKPTDEEYYIAAKIQILKWNIVSQNVALN